MEATLQRIVVCPSCHGSLDANEDGLTCDHCAVRYPIENGQPDLRPQSPLSREVAISIGPPFERRPFPVAPLPRGPWPSVGLPRSKRFTGGNRLSTELVTHVPPAKPGDVLLEVGCGTSRLGALLADSRGYEYVGIDLAASTASLLADAHALPFGDGTIAACCSFATLEHVRSPHLVALEVARVLKAEATFVGTVAFLEPYHEQSHFHHTHLGLLEILTNAGFSDVLIEGNPEWFVTDALTTMYAAESMPLGRYFSPLLRPVLRLLSHTTRRTVRHDSIAARRVAAGFRFVAHAPSATPALS